MNGYAKGLLAAVTSVALLSGCGEKQVAGEKPGAAKPMHSVLNELDLDGDVLVYCDGKSVSKDLSDSLNELADAMPPEIGPKMKLADEALGWLGIYDIQSFAYSAKMTDAPMTELTEIVEMKSGWKQHALWNVFCGQSAMESRWFAPKGTVLYEAWNVDVDSLWIHALDGVGRFASSEMRAMLEQQMLQAATPLEVDPVQLMESLSGELFINVALDEDKMVELPIPGSTEPIGEPSILIGFGLNSDAVVKDVIAALQKAGMPLQQEEHNGIAMHTIALPSQAEMPFDVSPAIAVVDGYLIISSSKSALLQAAADKKSGEGMIATDQYKAWLSDTPEKMSALVYMSPEFMKQYVGLISTMMNAQMQQGGNAQMGSMVAMQMGMYKDLYGGGYCTANGDRIEIRGNYSLGGYTAPSYALQSVIRGFGTQFAAMAPMLLTK